jgi:V8-like Glu-specific endopeptidase
LTTIVGEDNRQNCTKDKWPYVAVGQIDIADAYGGEVCSGVLVGPDTVLTAAHCVWNEIDGTFVEGLSFAPGRYRDGCKVISPHGIIPWRYATIFKSYQDRLQPDVAIVKLELPIGLKVGWLGMRTICNPATATARARGSNKGPQLVLPLTEAGYPKSQTIGACETSQCKVPVTECESVALDHECDTEAGQSGASLWDAQGFVRMVHNTGDLFSDDGKIANLGTALTQFIFDNIISW